MDARILISKRVARELRHGSMVNLGIGLPTMIPMYLPPGVEVYFQSENGIIGMSPMPGVGMEEPSLTDAGGGFVGAIPGAASIDSCLQSCGLTQRLLPVRASKYGLALDTLTIKRVLLDSASYRSFATVKDHDMPRVSPILNMYRAGLVELATHYSNSGNRPACISTIDRMAALLSESVYPMWPDLDTEVKRLR